MGEGVALRRPIGAPQTRAAAEAGFAVDMFGRDFGDESAGNAAHPLAVDTAVGGVAMVVMRYPVPRWNVLRVHIWWGIVVTFMALRFFAALGRMPLAALGPPLLRGRRFSFV